MLDPVHFPQLMVPRLVEALRRLEASVWRRDDRPLRVSATEPRPELLDARRAAKLKFHPVRRLPDIWGHMFDQRWWKLSLPRSGARRGRRYLYWDDQAEATVYHRGEPIFGIDPGHRYGELADGATTLLVESICCKTGVWVPGDQETMSSRGSVFSGAFLAQRDDDAWHAMHDLQVLTEALLAVHLPGYPAGYDPASGYGYRPPIHEAPALFRTVLRQLDDAINVYDRSGAPAFRRALDAIYRSLALPRRSHTAIQTGHAHIDLVWLWPGRVGRFKAVHSFANALSVLARYPEAHFTYSQPASYRDVRALSPSLMKRVRAEIRAGRWEATGTLEVESDTQLPCGEALVRAFDLGMRGFLTLNGPKRGPGRVVWLPDTFGYAGCIPQIMAGFGVPYFFTTKIHWGSATRFPYTSFRWRGQDGSEVLAHVIQDHYNQEARPAALRHIAQRHQQADIHPEVLVPTGYGDGGGGPNEAMAERTRRIARLGLLGEIAGVPDAKWGRIDAFFDRLDQRRAVLPVWRGEMYLQYHRGVQTTHADLKAAYRAAERALQVWEAVRCATGGGPIDEDAWRELVFTQFHDCLPGSSIWEVCRESVGTLRRVADEATRSAKEDLQQSPGERCVFNPLAMPTYLIMDKTVRRIGPLTGAPRNALQRIAAAPPKVTHDSLTNDRINVSFDKRGQVRSLTIDGKPVSLAGPSAQLWSFPDHPVNYDAWDIDRYTLSNGACVNTPAKVSIEHKGTLNAGLAFRRKIGRHSEAVIRYRLDPVRALLRIDMRIDWREPQTLLKMVFPTAYAGRAARFGAPFGGTTRPQSPGPIENDAMFEVPASRWAVVCDDGGSEGLTLVTESKYGFGCADGLLHVSLLRSAKITQPVPGAPRRGDKRGAAPRYSDLGRHDVRLALGRFRADAPLQEQPAALAETLFNPPIVYTGRPVSAGLAGFEAGPGLVASWAKPLSAKRWVLRLHETLGQNAVCRVDADKLWKLSRLDLRDQATGNVTRNRVHVKPYQILSLAFSRDKRP